MSSKSESSAQAIGVALEELILMAEEGGLPMLSYLLGMALEEASARYGETRAAPSFGNPPSRDRS